MRLVTTNNVLMQQYTQHHVRLIPGFVGPERKCRLLPLAGVNYAAHMGSLWCECCLLGVVQSSEPAPLGLWNQLRTSCTATLTKLSFHPTCPLAKLGGLPSTRESPNLTTGGRTTKVGMWFSL